MSHVPKHTRERIQRQRILKSPAKKTQPILKNSLKSRIWKKLHDWFSYIGIFGFIASLLFFYINNMPKITISFFHDDLFKPFCNPCLIQNNNFYSVDNISSKCFIMVVGGEIDNKVFTFRPNIELNHVSIFDSLYITKFNSMSIFFPIADSKKNQKNFMIEQIKYLYLEIQVYFKSPFVYRIWSNKSIAHFHCYVNMDEGKTIFAPSGD